MLPFHQIRGFETLSPSSASVVQCRSDLIFFGLDCSFMLPKDIVVVPCTPTGKPGEKLRHTVQHTICNSFCANEDF